SAGKYRPYATDEMVLDAVDDAVLDVIIRYRGNFDASTDDSEAFDDALFRYLYKTAINKLLTALRRDGRARELFPESLDARTPHHDRTSTREMDVASNEDGPEDAAHAAQRRKLVLECFE